MPLLHLINVDGSSTSKEYSGELEYLAPSFKEMYKILNCSTIEHVDVLFKGRPCHMFVDEDGRAHGLTRNELATRIYYNATFEREGKLALITDRLEVPEGRLRAGVETPGFDIVGPALLWEGDLE